MDREKFWGALLAALDQQKFEEIGKIVEIVLMAITFAEQGDSWN